MLPERLLHLERGAGQVFPCYLTPRSRPWVEAMLDQLQACVGRPREEVERRLAHRPGFGEAPLAWRALAHLLLRQAGFAVRSPVPPRQARAALFGAAASAPSAAARARALTGCARQLATSEAALLASLYADIPPRRVLRPPAAPLEPARVMELYNLSLAQGLLQQARWVTFSARGGLKAALRWARLQGLLCEVRRAGDRAAVHLSGPLALFRGTTRYGRALARWLPAATLTPGWELQACCVLGGSAHTWRASARDPLGSTHALPRRFDSQLEQRFFRDLQRATDRWQVLREADPVQVGARILCPDFSLIDRHGGARVLVELVGFWTPAYLQRKRDDLSRLPPGARWLVCVDSALDLSLPAGPAQGSATGGQPAQGRGPGRARDGPPIFTFRRRIPMDRLLPYLDALRR